LNLRRAILPATSGVMEYCTQVCVVGSKKAAWPSTGTAIMTASAASKDLERRFIRLNLPIKKKNGRAGPFPAFGTADRPHLLCAQTW